MNLSKLETRLCLPSVTSQNIYRYFKLFHHSQEKLIFNKKDLALTLRGIPQTPVRLVDHSGWGE